MGSEQQSTHASNMENRIIDFQVFSWDGRDIESTVVDEKGNFAKTTFYIVDAYGRTEDGLSVCAHVSFMPYCFASIAGISKNKLDELLSSLQTQLPSSQIRCSIVQRKPFYGFTNGTLEDFLLVRCVSQRALRKAAVIISKANLTLYESNVPPVLRLMHIRQLPSVGWIRCVAPKNLTAKAHEKQCTNCDLEFNCSYQSLEPVPGRTENAPLVVASFDIECVSETGGFPCAHEVGCPIIQIATTFWRITEDQPYKRHLACLGHPLPIEGVIIDACETEQEVLLAWAEALRQEQVDILIGYNIFGFDLKYCFDRANLRGALGTRLQPLVPAGTEEPAIRRFPYLMGGKRTDHMSEIQVRKLESSAYGANEFYTPTMPGVLQIDLLAVIKKEYKLTSYKLDAVAEHFLGDRKVDLPIKQMFALYKQGTPEALQQIAEYCVKDTELPIQLMRKLAILPNMIEMAKAVHVPIDYLIFRGQQIKVFSVILKKAREEGYVCPSKPLVTKTEKYTGATVLEAKVGAHFGFIACLDFASLYPSIIRAHNMCHSTIVLDDNKYGHLPDVTYDIYDLGDGQLVKFASSYQGSILPALLADLAEYRKQARRLQKQAKERGDNFLESLYNGKQLAYKVTMNSLYGFCGAANGLLPCVPIAAAVTTVGRSMIDKTRKLVEQYYAHLGASVVYGDSVAGYTPVLVRLGGKQIVCMPIEELADLPSAGSWQAIQGTTKESCELPDKDVEAWTEAGWTLVERIIRHAYAKPLVRVITPSGLVDVTEDHSLLLPDGSPIAPKQIVIGTTELLHAALPLTSSKTRSSSLVSNPHQARVMGMFYGGERSCSLSSWALTAKVRSMLDPYLQLCNKAYPGHIWSIYQTMDSQSAPFSLLPFDGIGEWINSYDEIIQHNKVPMDILCGAPQVRAAFLQGLKDSNPNNQSVSGYWSFMVTSQLAAMSLFMLAESLGYSAVIDSTRASAGTFEVVFSQSRSTYKMATTVKKAMSVPSTDYVYDLTTANHHFHAGVGKLIVHNTDSVMCDFKVDTLEEAFRLGQEAAKRITEEHFKFPICLEFEKVQSPFLLYSKKRYASLKFTDPHEPGKIDAKGISLVRRDSCGLVRTVTKQALELILLHRNPEAAGYVIHEAARRLLAGEVALEDLVMSKALRGCYKAGTLQPHDVVRSKIAERSPGEEPRPGDRVEFVYVEGNGLNWESVTCRAEDPAYVRSASAAVIVDYHHYLHLLKSALADTIEVLSPQLDTVFTDIGEEAFLKQCKRRMLHANNARTGQKEITSFFSSADPFRTVSD